MPRATLTFNLPGERVEHQNAVDSGRAFSLLSAIDKRIRGRLKYGLGEGEKDVEVFEEIRAMIHDDFPDLDER